jgi:hypothetical protein
MKRKTRKNKLKRPGISGGTQFTLEDFNSFLQYVLNGIHFKIPEIDPKYENCITAYYDEAFIISLAYTDFINVFCLINGVRNGIHLDNFTQTSTLIFGGDSGFNAESTTYIYNILFELTRLNLVGKCPEFKYYSRFEVTIWDPKKVPNEIVLNSWAFQGDAGRNYNDPYWKNNAILFGNHLGYPSYSKDNPGIWSLNLIFSMNGIPLEPVSMCGGYYDKSKPNDLDSIKYIKDFLQKIVGKELYNPDGTRVTLNSVNIDIR